MPSFTLFFFIITNESKEDGLYGSWFTRDSVLPYLEEIPEAPSNQDLCFSTKVGEIVKRVACMAKNHNITVVVNMGEVQYCNGKSGCPADGRLQFNTQIAVNEKGFLLAKYHKTHLYFEPQWNAGDGKAVFFTTSFRVKIGLMICFDLMFEFPQSELLSLGVRDVAYSSWWVNTPPLISATQSQQSWSRKNKVNLMASGIGLNMYSSGSGVYDGQDGTFQSFFNPVFSPDEKLLVKKIPVLTQKVETLAQLNLLDKQRQPLKKKQEKFSWPDIWKEAGLKPTVKSFKPLPGFKDTLQVQYGNLTCIASYSVSNTNFSSGELFALVAFNGNYIVQDTVLFPLQLCALVKCGNESDSSCGQFSMQSNTPFDSFQLTTTSFHSLSEKFFMLASDNLQIVDSSFSSFEQNNSTSTFFSTQNLKQLPIVSACMYSVKW